MSECFTVGLQEAEKSTRNKVETVSPDTLYIDFVKDPISIIIIYFTTRQCMIYSIMVMKLRSMTIIHFLGWFPAPS